MSSKSFVLSAVLHGVVLALMVMDFSLARWEEHKTPPALLMVDLTKVQVSDKTNLPPKAQAKPKKSPKPQPPKPHQVEKSRPTQVRAAKPEAPKPLPQPPVKDAVPVVETKKKTQAPKISKSKSDKPSSVSKSKNKQSAKPTYDMKSLLASVEKVRRQAPVSPVPEEPDDLPRQNDGIEGGMEGSFSQVLTISERDLIANQLKKCWNVDAGAVGVDNMIIEIRAFVNKDGRVRDVRILNMKPDPSFRAVAESARRAVLICDTKKDESPFKILADKYADHYGTWKELYLRFNPMDGGVF